MKASSSLIVFLKQRDEFSWTSLGEKKQATLKQANGSAMLEHFRSTSTHQIAHRQEHTAVGRIAPFHSLGIWIVLYLVNRCSRSRDHFSASHYHGPIPLKLIGSLDKRHANIDYISSLHLQVCLLLSIIKVGEQLYCCTLGSIPSLLLKKVSTSK